MQALSSIRCLNRPQGEVKIDEIRGMLFNASGRGALTVERYKVAVKMKYTQYKQRDQAGIRLAAQIENQNEEINRGCQMASGGDIRRAALPRVSPALKAGLKLTDDKMQGSRDITSEFGNMSSASVLVVLDQIRTGL
uniref:Chalcone/stilbene synthase C-terminal domain-containing protein n=1 Tax=Physcomitrium patens TaxID=3218 RepID=A0A2K1IYC0_PHYPA|nr:hypothetical protein PHYPA_024090 [Physcomitrium patens]